MRKNRTVDIKHSPIELTVRTINAQQNPSYSTMKKDKIIKKGQYNEYKLIQKLRIISQLKE